MGNQTKPQGQKLIQNCLKCPIRHEGFFCQFAPRILEELNSIGQLALYPKGAILFWKGQAPLSAFVLCSGRIRTSATSARGRSVAFRIAKGGNILGVCSLLLDQPYTVTAEALEPVQAKIIFRAELMRFMQTHKEVSQRVAVFMSENLVESYQQVTRIVLSSTPKSKLISLLLDMANREGHPSESGNLRLDLHLTHAQLGELIGISREMVSRLLSELRKQGLIQTKGTSVTLLDTAKLGALLD